MNCNDIKNNISLYIDEQLEPDELEEIRMHLNSCRSCFNEYEQLIINRDTLNKIPYLPLPAGFQESLHDRLMNEKKIDNTKMWKRYSLIAALFLIGLVSVLQKDLILEKVGMGQDQKNIESYRMAASHDKEDISMDNISIDPGSKGDRILTMADNSIESSEQKSFMTMEEPQNEEENSNKSMMGPQLGEKDAAIQKEMLQTGTAVIIGDSIDNIPDYLQQYTGATNLHEKFFAAALDSVTPEFEISVPMEEFDSVFNFLAEYEKTVDYMELESSDDLEVYRDNENIIIIIDQY